MIIGSKVMTQNATQAKKSRSLLQESVFDSLLITLWLSLRLHTLSEQSLQDILHKDNQSQGTFENQHFIICLVVNKHFPLESIQGYQSSQDLNVFIFYPFGLSYYLPIKAKLMIPILHEIHTSLIFSFEKHLFSCIHVECAAHSLICWKCFEDLGTWDLQSFPIAGFQQAILIFFIRCYTLHIKTRQLSVPKDFKQ